MLIRLIRLIAISNIHENKHISETIRPRLLKFKMWSICINSISKILFNFWVASWATWASQWAKISCEHTISRTAWWIGMKLGVEVHSGLLQTWLVFQKNRTIKFKMAAILRILKILKIAILYILDQIFMGYGTKVSGKYV